MLKIKKIFTIFIMILLLTPYTNISFAISDDIFVWSPQSTETVTTSSAISSNTR